MVILSFHKYTDIAAWNEVERTSPGGLSPESLRLGAPLKVYSVDEMWHEAAVSRSGQSVFLVIPYDVLSLDGYKPYVAAYVIPQMKAGCGKE